MAYPSMELHGSTWRTKKRTPHDLQAYYPGKSWHRFNTGEADKKAAAVLVHRWVADLAEEWQRLRETRSPHKQSIAPDEVAHIVRLGLFDSAYSSLSGWWKKAGGHRDALTMNLKT